MQQTTGLRAGTERGEEVARHQRHAEWQYRIAGKETLSIAGKPMATTRVVQSAGGKQTVAWIAQGIPVPVRIVQREDGSEVFSLRIKSWR